MPQPNKGPRTQIGVRLTPTQLEALDALQDASGLPQSTIIGRLVVEAAGKLPKEAK